MVFVNGVCYVVVFAFSKPHLIDNLSDHKYAPATCVEKNLLDFESIKYANLDK